MSKEQLRAARALLGLRQDELARLAKVGVATLRRFEGGSDVNRSCLDAMRRAVEEAGVLLLDPTDDGAPMGRGMGVALKDVPGSAPTECDAAQAARSEPR